MEYPLDAEKVRAYIRMLHEAERSDSTIEKYARELYRFAAWLGGRPMTKEAVIEYKAELVQCHAPASVNCILAALNGFFSYMNWPGLRVKRLRIQRTLYADAGRELSKAEYLRLVAAAKERRDDRLALVLQTLCSLGLRVSELPAITLRAVQQGRAEIRNKGKFRTVFLPRGLCTRLIAYCRGRQIRGGPVFVTRTGRPLDRSNIWTMMKALCKSAKVAPRKVFPHNLRHLFARTYYAAQHDLVRLADLLGHASTATTRIYTMESGLIHARQIEQLGLLVT